MIAECSKEKSPPGGDRVTHSISSLIHKPKDETVLSTYYLYGEPLICLTLHGEERLCLAQISGLLLRDFSYNEIHNRRVALGITCVQCTSRQLELLRRVGAMPSSSRRCGTITKREAQRLVESFLQDLPPPKLPENFAFEVEHNCGWGCQGYFIPARYNSSRAKCVQCAFCQAFFSPNKFVFHCHTREETGRQQVTTYRHPDAANFNAWRRHLVLADPDPPEELLFAWEDVKAMFNGGNRKKTSPFSSEASMAYTPEASPPPLKRRCPVVSKATPSADHAKGFDQQVQLGTLATAPEALTRADFVFKKYRSVFTSLLEQTTLSQVESCPVGSVAWNPSTTHAPLEHPVPLNRAIGLVADLKSTVPVNQSRIGPRDWLENLLLGSTESIGSPTSPVSDIMGNWTSTLKSYLEMMARGIYLPPPPPPPSTT
ncbi:unnamed protein product [Schistocephalus solidus]|uniref:C-SKI_SMAD_bind domain-containing protein n=1 Tax=Schistocephalus solidus TaxID=70667 RepID=A0A183SSP5_SCHSO|nr:unnamed protein product [Schistocephalus solidus]